jgi:hypothetical protein
MAHVVDTKGPITPTALKHLRRLERETRTARVAALHAARATPRAKIIAREDAIGVWWDARFWHRNALAKLADALARPVVKGAHVSPAAKARAIANGRWIDDGVDSDGRPTKGK